ncbi:MAG: DUF6585 family protein [Cyanobacteria bacterium P01_F01_bin.150]
METANQINHSVLGDYRSTFPAAAASVGLMRGMAIGLFCLAGFSIAVNPSAIGVTIAALLGAIACFSGIYAWWEASLKVEVYDSGLIYHRGIKRDIIPFSLIAEIRQVPHYGRRHRPPLSWRYNLILQSGQKVHLTGLKRIRQLGSDLETIVTQELWDKTWQQFQSGEPLMFGDVAFSQAGLTFDKTQIPLQSIHTLACDAKGKFVVFAKDSQRAVVNLLPWRVANIGLLQALYQKAIQSVNASVPSPSSSESMKGASIGAISSRIGCDVRELIMDGYSLEQINQVVQGKKTLGKLMKERPVKDSQR